MDLIELKKEFNRLEKERKNYYWLIDNLPDSFLEVRKDLRQKFSLLKNLFLKYKNKKELLNEEVIEQLKNNLNKFEVYINKKIEKEKEKLNNY